MSNLAQQRDEIRSRLAGGLRTEAFPRADTPEERESIILRLRTGAGDLEAKLVIAGFGLRPVEHGGFTQHCESCMYFRIHQKHCELPELDVPVESEWSCRLWRI
jgi:hypothetical protein